MSKETELSKPKVVLVDWDGTLIDSFQKIATG